MARSAEAVARLRWHTIYTRMNRWSKNGVLDQVFEKLQLEQIVRIKIEAFALDSTSIKVRIRTRTGRSKKRPLKPSASRADGWNTKVHRWLLAECSNGYNLRPCRPAMRTMLPKVAPCWRNWGPCPEAAYRC